MGSTAEHNKTLGAVTKVRNFAGVKWNRLVKPQGGLETIGRGLRPAMYIRYSDDGDEFRNLAASY